MISDYDQRNFVKLFDTLDQKMYTAYILHFAISENIFDILPDIFLYIAFHLLYPGKCTEIQIHFSSSIPMSLDKLQSLSDTLQVLHFYDTLQFLFFRSLLVDIVFLRLLSHPTYVLKLDHVF